LNRRKREILLIAFATVIFFIASCDSIRGKSGAQNTPPNFKIIEPLHAKTKIKFMPNWYPESEFAGFYTASRKGFYSEENLDVEFVRFDYSYDIKESLSRGVIDFAVMSMPELAEADNSGLKIKAIAALFQTDPSVFIVMKNSGIKNPKDFEGKKIIVKNHTW
jgi:NitT/TauT family transport system substrate-binding protein